MNRRDFTKAAAALLASPLAALSPSRAAVAEPWATFSGLPWRGVIFGRNFGGIVAESTCPWTVELVYGGFGDGGARRKFYCGTAERDEVFRRFNIYYADLRQRGLA